MNSSVVITGAASGMGRCHALLLAKRGWHVHLADVAPLNEVLSEIHTAGGAATAHTLDVSSSEAWKRLGHALQDTAGGHPPVRGLVNNAGVVARASIVDTDDAEWRRTLSINLDGVFYGLRELAPLISLNGGGSIVNVSSAGGLVGYHSAAYGASKWAVRGLTKTAAAEFSHAGVRCNSIHPGLIETPLLQGAESFRDSHIHSIPAGRAGSPEEVSALVAFLLSDEATYISGAEIAIDGAFTSSGLYHRVKAETATMS